MLSYIRNVFPHVPQLQTNIPGSHYICEHAFLDRDVGNSIAHIVWGLHIIKRMLGIPPFMGTCSASMTLLRRVGMRCCFLHYSRGHLIQ